MEITSRTIRWLRRTVGGLVFHYVGHVPLVGDEVRVDGLLFRVERMEGTRISKVRVTRAEPAPEPGEGHSVDSTPAVP